MDKVISFLEEDDSYFDTICETDDPEEQFKLARQYIEGLGGNPQDKEKGMNYLRRSMRGENYNAILYYSSIFLQEQGFETVLQCSMDDIQEICGSNDPIFYFTQG